MGINLKLEVREMCIDCHHPGLTHSEMVKLIEEKVVVTRHKGLIDYLKEVGLIGYYHKRILSHVSVDDVKGKHVIGVLPLSLAVHAASVTEIPLDLPEGLRGKELTKEDMYKYAGLPVTYVVSSECPSCGKKILPGSLCCLGKGVH